MELASHPLKTILQLHLTSDISAASHLSHALTVLDDQCLLPSPHLSKLTARINSLLHSKEACGRWAGLCLACRISECSKSLMIEYAQGWLSVALPLLSREESIPVLKAGIRLLYKIFSGAMDTSEFQRQVSIPNVPKMTAAMIALTNKRIDVDFKAFILSTLSKLTFLYPNLHRASHSALSSLALDSLNGSTLGPTNSALLEAASQLYVVLHFTGGKMGAGDLWRKSVEETLTFGWSAFCALRTTFPTEVQVVNVSSNTGSDDPVVNMPLNLDRLRCCVTILRDLYRTPTSRPVQLPLGLLVRFIVGILACSSESQVEGHVDANVRALELAAVQDIWKMGCQVLIDLTVCAGHHLTPHLPRLMSCLIIHLESKPKTSLRLACLTAAQALLMHCHPLDSDILPNRLANCIQPLITNILTQASSSSKSNDQIRKGKKRNRNFEGEEILKGGREALCQTPEDEQILLKSLEVFGSLWQNFNLSAQTRSILARNVVAVYLVLPRLPAALLSVDPFFHAQLCKKVQAAVLDIGTGSSNVSGRSLGLIVAFSDYEKDLQRHIDLLLHPRVPPLVRREPHVQSLPFYHNEEPREASVRGDQESTVPESPPNPLSELPKETPHVIREDQAPPQLPAITISKPVTSFQLDREVFKPPPIIQDTPDVPMASIQSRIQIQVQPTPAPRIQSTNDDEEMPEIDMASDSEDSDF